MVSEQYFLTKKDKELLHSLNRVFHKLDLLDQFGYWAQIQRIDYSVLDEKGYYIRLGGSR